LFIVLTNARELSLIDQGIPSHLQAVAAAPQGGGAGAAPEGVAAPAATTPSQPATAPAAQPIAQPAPAAPAAPAAPQNLFQLAQQQAQGGGGGGGGGGAAALAGLGGGGAGLGGANPNAAAALQGLRDQPQFAALRELVQQNPALIQPLIQQLAQNNPQMAQLINQNPEALFNILGEGMDDEEYVGGGTHGGAPGGMGGVQTINITADEHAAIQRVSDPLICLR